MRIVSRPTLGTSLRFTASSAIKRTVAGPAFGRITADHGDNPLALFGAQQTLRSGALFVIQGSFQPRILVAPSNFPDRFRCQMDIGSHLGNALASMELAQS
jgi:hypothetical protein